MSMISLSPAEVSLLQRFQSSSGVETPAATASRTWSVEELEALFEQGALSPEVMLLLLQVKDANQRIADTLERTNAFRRLTDAIRQRISVLRELEGEIRRLSTNRDNVGLEVKELATKRNMSPEELNDLLLEREYGLDENGRVTCEKTGGSLVGNVDWMAPNTVGADNVAKRIESLQKDIQRIDGMREGESMRMQEQVQLKERLVMLATNILQSQHKALEAITNNTHA